MADLAPTIETAAAEPRKAQADGVAAEAHSLTDQIAADRYLKSVAAASTPRRGLRFNRVVNPPASEHG